MVAEGVISAVVGAITGAISGTLAAYVLGERSKRHTYNLNEIYRPLRREFIGIRQIAWDRLGMKDDYYWTKSEEYQQIVDRGGLLPKPFRELRNEVIKLEDLNKVMMDKSRELWSAIDSALDVAIRNPPDDVAEDASLAIADQETRQLLREHLMRPIYLDQKDDTLEFLDMQTKEWKHYDKITILKTIAPLIRSKTEELVLKKRREFLVSRQDFDKKLDLILSGLAKSIESGGSKRYRTPPSKQSL